MKQLTFKIMTIVLLAILFTLGPSLFILVNRSKAIIRDLSLQYLESEVEKHSIDFDEILIEAETTTLALEGITTYQLTEEILQNEALFDAYREEKLNQYRAIAGTLKPLDLYTWFDPDELHRSRTITVSDTQRDGVYEVEQEYDYTWDDIISEGWTFFSEPKENGTNWTDPYFWEAFDVDLFSYTKALNFNGRFIGVTGIDVSFEAIKEAVSDAVILESGYYVLVNANMDVLVHPVLEMGVSMSESLPVVAEAINGDTDGHGHRVLRI